MGQGWMFNCRSNRPGLLARARSQVWAGEARVRQLCPRLSWMAATPAGWGAYLKACAVTRPCRAPGERLAPIVNSSRTKRALEAGTSVGTRKGVLLGYHTTQMYFINPLPPPGRKLAVWPKMENRSHLPGEPSRVTIPVFLPVEGVTGRV